MQSKWLKNQRLPTAPSSDEGLKQMWKVQKCDRGLAMKSVLFLQQCIIQVTDTKEESFTDGWMDFIFGDLPRPAVCRLAAE